MSIKVKDLKSKHPEYDSELIKRYDLLYEGGEAFLEQVRLFLPRRNSEANKVYDERIQRAFYIGYVGPIIDYFIASLFSFEPNINQDEEIDSFYEEFLKNCDLKNNSISEFFRQVFLSSLIHCKSYILIDSPRIPDNIVVENRQQEIELGLDKSYLVHFNKSDLLDWQYDENGNFEWVKFYCFGRRRDSYNSKEIISHRWYIYTKYSYEVYQYDEDPEEKISEDQQTAILVSSGKLSYQGIVPVFCVDVPKGLWVMNKLASIQIELFNLDNAMSWQEYQAHYAMPVIKLSDGKKFKQKLGESYYIQLGTDESFEWSEPSGTMMDVGLRRRDMLKDEIFRVVHQLSLSTKQSRSQTRQSGSSKEEDRYATEIILRSFGDIIRNSMQSVLSILSAIRKDDIEWDISGYSTFDTESTTEKLAQILQLRAINIHSEIFNKEMEKRVIDHVLEDSNHEVKEEIKKEIDQFDFSTIVEDPLAGSFMSSSMKPKVTGNSLPAKQGEKPNRTRPQTKGKEIDDNRE